MAKNKEIRRLLRVYMDLTHYIKPVEVNKLFRLMDKRQNLMQRIDECFRGNKKAKMEVELAEVNSDMELLCSVICPTNATWGITKTTSQGETFWMLTISEPVKESLFDKGQDYD